MLKQKVIPFIIDKIPAPQVIGVVLKDLEKGLADYDYQIDYDNVIVSFELGAKNVKGTLQVKLKRKIQKWKN